MYILYYVYLYQIKQVPFFSPSLLVRRQKPIFGVKCAISGNNHFFAFFVSSCYVDEIWPGWELASGLAFSESKMAANLQYSVYLDVYFVLDTVEWWCWCQKVCCLWWGIQWCIYSVNLEPILWCNSTVDVKFTIKLPFLFLICYCTYRQTLLFLPWLVKINKTRVSSRIFRVVEEER